MSRSENYKAKSFLAMKLGEDPDPELAKLLDEYKEWHEDQMSSPERIIAYARKMGYDKRIRRNKVLDNRSYIAAYLFIKFGYGPVRLGQVFGKNHSTFSNMLRNFEFVAISDSFVKNTEETRKEFPTPLKVLAKKVGDKMRESSRERIRREEYKIFGGWVNAKTMEKYKEFQESRGLKRSGETITRLIKEVEI